MQTPFLLIINVFNVYLFLGLCDLGGQLVRRHAHVVEDVGQLTGVDAAVVGHVLLTTLMHVEVTG